jgi:hypothetical protein
MAVPTWTCCDGKISQRFINLFSKSRFIFFSRKKTDIQEGTTENWGGIGWVAAVLSGVVVCVRLLAGHGRYRKWGET